ncbi:MAG: aminotransferase class III-fold pyridoxal phosphate-dependent enzyme [Aestuariibacter sp.]
MSNTIQDLARQILAKNVERGDAMRQFDKLTASEQNQLIQQMNASLSNGKLNTDDSQRAATTKLGALDQRDLQEQHLQYIEKLAAEYHAFVPKSRDNIEKHQQYFVDQRRPFHLLKPLKKLHFQITYERAQDARVYDIDGNEYIDISGDMGVNIFGHKPEFVMKAVIDSLHQGIPLAGYSQSIFETSAMFSELTGHERVLFTQSGTEAVMFAVRIARAATGKQKVVIFEGAYHGLSDAVVAMADLQGNSIAMGPGMLQEFAEQIIVLPYGETHSLEQIEQQIDEIATVLVEPVQSRHPYLQPVQFLRELRNLTLAHNIPLIFDEMITGFRVCPQGAQGKFGIKADISTYGKIPGGGLPTGVIAGSEKYLNCVDGGTWQLDDDSMPAAKRTGMAGTHSQNPLKIAAVNAVLREMKKRCEGAGDCSKCNCFQKQLTSKTDYLAGELNGFFKAQSLPVYIDTFGSLFRFRFVDSFWGVTEALFFILLRMAGVETNIQGNCFLTTAHTDKDIEKVIAAVKSSMTTLIDNSFFQPKQETAKQPELAVTVPASAPKEVAEFSQQFTDAAPQQADMTDLRQMLKADLSRLQMMENQ